LGTMILGLVAGNILRADLVPSTRIRRFLVWGGGLMLAALLLHFTGVNPIVKRIWTPAWTLFSGGICFLFLTAFYWIIDVAQRDRWSFFLKVIGVNSIAAYVIADGGIKTFFQQSLSIHLGADFDQLFGSAYATLV